VAGRLLPDRVRHRLSAIAEARRRLGQRERRARGLGEVRRLAPGRDREDPLVGQTRRRPSRRSPCAVHIQTGPAANLCHGRLLLCGCGRRAGRVRAITGIRPCVPAGPDVNLHRV
jgi:hypothetical protein